MKKYLALTALILLTACQSAPRLEDDTRYVRLAKVVDVHVFSDAERKEAAKTAPRSGNSSVGVGIGFGTGFGGVMLGAGTSLGGGSSSRDLPPQVSAGANRYTVQPLHTGERIEVMSYKPYKVGDCVKVLSGHPTEFARLYDPKAGEHCD